MSFKEAYQTRMGLFAYKKLARSEFDLGLCGEIGYNSSQSGAVVLCDGAPVTKTRQAAVFWVGPECP